MSYQKILFFMALLMNSMSILATARQDFYYIDICVTCDENRSLILESAIDSVIDSALFLKRLSMHDFRYAEVYKTVFDGYQELSTRLFAWRFNNPFCKQKCKRTLHDVYAHRISCIKNILQEQLQQHAENIVNRIS